VNYSRIYDSLITRAKDRQIDNNQYYERHHIIPRCCGGGDEELNIVCLTGREHYIAHLLLWKMFPSNYKLLFAFRMMSHANNNGLRTYRYSARLYEAARQSLSTYLKTNKEIGMKVAAALRGRKQNIEHVRKRMNSRKRNGKKYTAEQIEKYRNGRLRALARGWRPNTTGLRQRVKGEFKHSDKTKDILRHKRLGKTFDEIYGPERSLQLRQQKKEMVGSKNPNFRIIDVELVRDMLNKGMQMKKIITELNSSYVTISKRFKDAFGISVSDYTDSIGLTKNGSRLNSK
jgi:AraC-like DNA-binding protein